MSAPKLRFKEFDGEWNFQLLGNMAEFVSGYAFDSEKFGESGRKLITPKNFTIFGRALFTQQNTKYTTESCDEKFVCRGNDLLVLLTDLTQSCELLGKPVLLNYVNEEILLNQRILKIQPNEDVVSKSFLLNYFLTENYLKHIKETSTGTTVRHSSNKILAKQTIFYPSIEEQTQIASFLSAVDEKISQLTQKHELLSQYKQGMMQKLFSQQLRFKADDGSEFREWGKKKVSDLFVEIKDKVLNQDIETYSITAGKGFVSQAEKFGRDISGMQNSNYIVLKPNDFSYNKGNSKTFKYGCVYLNEFNNSIAVPNVFISFRAKPTNNIYEKFYAQLFENHHLDRHLRLLISSSARMDGLLNVSKQGFFEIMLPFPCLEEQTKIANFLSAIDQKIEVVAQQIEQAKQWKKGLLQQMFV